jgi:hypothetical protein
MSSIRKFIRKTLLKEFGRNYQTINTNPISYKDFQDYDVEVFPSEDQNWLVSVSFRGKPISRFSRFGSMEEAEHFARKTVEDHKVKFQNSFV